MLLSGVRDVGVSFLLSASARIADSGTVLCIGFNGLHQLPNETTSNGDDDDRPRYSLEEENCPDGKRQWLWLVLCDDG
jgi:hypothetical protein